MRGYDDFKFPTCVEHSMREELVGSVSQTADPYEQLVRRQPGKFSPDGRVNQLGGTTVESSMSGNSNPRHMTSSKAARTCS